MILDQPIIKHPEPVEPEHLVGDKIQPGHPLFGLIWINPLRVSGEPCFYPTRLPIKYLFEYLASGHTVEEFVDEFEGISIVNANLVLEVAGRGLLADLTSI